MLKGMMVMESPTGAAPHLLVMAFEDSVMRIDGEMVDGMFQIERGSSRTLDWLEYPDAKHVMVDDNYWNHAVVARLLDAAGLTQQESKGL